MTRIMRDSDAPSAVPTQGTDIVAGYVSGSATWPRGAYDRFRGIPHAHIDCLGTMPEKAEILDVEDGCSTVQAAVSWVRKRKAAFPGAYPPVLYCNGSTLTPLFNAMHAAGFHVIRDFRVWLATLDGTKKIHDMTGIIAVQYKRAPNLLPDGSLERPSSSVTAGHYDQSIVYDDAWDPGDDLPYTRQQIRHWVQRGAAAGLGDGRSNREILKLVRQGVEAELGAAIETSGVSAAQGAAAAVHAGDALAGISGQLTALAVQVAALAGTGHQQPVR
jgi:hypothetical protein